MKTKHTPTLWTQYIAPKQFHAGICSTNGDQIAFVQNQKDYNIANANAEFIIRAVNSHDALLENLKACLKRLRELDRKLLETNKMPFECELGEVTRAEKAIAQAEEK